MSSLARRSIRTAAAAAGVAALGIGFAGPALATQGSAEESPAQDATTAPAADTAVPGLADVLKAADIVQTGLPALPDVFAAPIPTEMNAAAVPTLPDTSEVLVTKGTDVEFNSAPEADGVSGNNGALADLDSANLFADLAKNVATGQSMTSDNDISN